MNVLELYSGIGGMHFALNASGLQANVVCAVEINTVANAVYAHNFPQTNLINRNIQSLTADYLNKLNVNVILMSPPCQPFTRNGKFGDTEDARSNSFLHVLELINDVTSLQYILIENVKGFEKSNTRDILIKALHNAKFAQEEYLISPTEVGVPNSRTRYYCLATKQSDQSLCKEAKLKTFDNGTGADPFSIADIIEENAELDEYFLNEAQLMKRLKVVDVCYPESTRSCCFTKAYGRYLEGTGSVFTALSEDQFKALIAKIECPEPDSNVYRETLNELQLRYFSPREVARLMSFPENFSFPSGITTKQKYRLLGNSLNVKVVANLIQILLGGL